MFTKLFVPVLLVVSSAVFPAFAVPTPQVQAVTPVQVLSKGVNNLTVLPTPLNDTAARFPEFGLLYKGNQDFRAAVANSSNPNLLKDLATKGQFPGFLFLGCSDSRVSERTIFTAPPGSIFTQRNIANQFQPVDNNAMSVLSYGVQSLGVGHVIVMGHYGCGGVQGAMMPKPNTADDFAGSSVQSWINPIRYTFANSSRPEIVSWREANKGKTTVESPKLDDPAFRALVEENVKDSVFNVITSPVMRQHWTAYIAQNSTSSSRQRRAAPSNTPLKPVYVHGFVYDLLNGEVTDLGVSFGPHGPTSKAPPQGAVKRAIGQQVHSHDHL